MINAEYGKPVLVRFINRLDENPLGLDRQDFGSPDWSFLTHLHNGHTAPESDGNPHYSMNYGPKAEGYLPGEWVDNLYLNWPAGGDDREKQTFFWFHDHRMDHTGSNVYKGMVGLYPIYDPKDGMDMGDETKGLRLPGVRKDNADGSFDVEYDIPLAIYDRRLDDGVTLHQDIHDGMGEFPAAKNPADAPGVVGQDVLQALPQPRVRRRHLHRQRHRQPGAGGEAAQVPVAVPRRLGRADLRLPADDLDPGPEDGRVARLHGDELRGPVPHPRRPAVHEVHRDRHRRRAAAVPIPRDNFELWPAKRREVIVDFTRYQDGSPTKKGDVIYLTNTMKMPDGRMWTNSSRFIPDPAYKVPVMKIVIGDDAEDNSQIPSYMRTPPPLPANWKTMMNNRLIFEVQRGSVGGEVEWLVNGKAFDPARVGQEQDEPGRSVAAGPAEEGQLQPVGAPQRRRRLGAPDAPAHGGAPHGHAQPKGRHQVQSGAPRRRGEGRPGGLGSG